MLENSIWKRNENMDLGFEDFVQAWFKEVAVALRTLIGGYIACVVCA